MIDVDKLLDALGVEHHLAGPDNFRILCINPNHEDTKPSMFIHRETAIMHCFGCGLTGNVFTLLRYKGITGAEALLYLQNFPLEGYTEEDVKNELYAFVQRRGVSIGADKDKEEPLTNTTNVELPPHRLLGKNTYLKRRGVSRSSINKWKISIVVHGRYKDWILIPLYQEGTLRNYFLRSQFGSGKMYGKYERRDILAGLDFCDLNKPICVTEGIFDTLALERIGFQSVACLSNKLLPEQIEKLKKFKKVVIVPDTDAMGLKLVESAGELIYNSEVSVYRIPNGKKDAGECSAEELLIASKTEIPWNKYLINAKFS